MAEKETLGTRTALAAPSLPTITVPDKQAAAQIGSGLSFSPGPLTFVSSLFADSFPEPAAESRSTSFSQLLAGTMASPAAFAGGPNQNEGLSPLFNISSGFSPSAFLDSPGRVGVSHQHALPQVAAYQPLEPLVSHIVPMSNASTQALARNSPNLTHTDKRSDLSCALNVEKPGDDGYNWRKYGQKPIKGCEFPRSYYKCTHANCPVKKKVERSCDGQITQIIYKGQHSHEKPQNRRGRDGRDSSEISGFGCGGILETQRQTGAVEVMESSDSEERVKRQSREDDEDGYDNDNDDDADDRASKIRKTVGEPGASVSHRTLTEPKIVVQTRSEVDLLDDGYKWRKYGQKAVKGNPHPRSYYKCTTAGCTVRKHVERASTDPKAVITTYEGKHNHDVPAARNSNSKPQNTVSKNHTLLNDMSFGAGGQRPVLLRLKEEKITV